MKQLKKYCLCLLLLTTLLAVSACGRTDNGAADNNGEAGTAGEAGTGTEDAAGNDDVNIDDILFDTDGDGVYDHTDVDGDGLLEEIGRDANDVTDDLVNDVTEAGDSLMDDVDGNNGTTDNEGMVENGNGTTAP